MPDSENDILRDAIIGTEKEIFSDAFGKEDLTLDETGDRSLEATGEGLEGQVEPEEDEEAEEAEDAPAADAADKVVTKPVEAKAKAEAEATVAADAAARQREARVPSGRLKEEAERARAAVAERDALKVHLESQKSEWQKAIEAQNAKYDAVVALLQRQQQTQAPPKPAVDQPKPETAPDLFENPTAFAEHIRKGVQEEIAAMRKQANDDRINNSVNLARLRHRESFDVAYKSLTTTLDRTNPQHQAIVQGILAHPDPGEALMSWHKRNEVMREVGEDPAAYKARIAEETRTALAADPEFRRQLLESLRAEASGGDGGQPKNKIVLPPSLGRAAGGNGRAPNDLEGFDGSENAIFASAFST